MTVTSVRMSDVDLTSCRLGLNPRPIHVGFVVEEVALGQDFLRVLRIFPRQYYFTNVPYSFKDAIKPRQLVVPLNDTIK